MCLDTGVMGALWAVEHTQSQRGVNPQNHSPNSAYEPSGLNHTCPGKTKNKVANCALNSRLNRSRSHKPQTNT